jgi:hypothetical protein
MLPTPLLHSAHLLFAAEVIPTGGSAPPTALAGELAGLSASRCRTVLLGRGVSVIGTEEYLAATALARGNRAAHYRLNRVVKKTKINQEHGPGKKTQIEEGRRAFSANSRRKPNAKKTEF